MVFKYKIALFGEAEKGDFRFPYECRTLEELKHRLGEPPPFSSGLFFAVQTLLFHHPVVFFRVQEEGYSFMDYQIGLDRLREEKSLHEIKALAMPGVVDEGILQKASPLLSMHKILIFSERDLMDYLTRS